MINNAVVVQRRLNARALSAWNASWNKENKFAASIPAKSIGINWYLMLIGRDTIYGTSNSPSKLEIFRHYGYTFCMNRTQVAVFKKVNEEVLRSFLNRQEALRCVTKGLWWNFIRNFPNLWRVCEFSCKFSCKFRRWKTKMMFPRTMKAGKMCLHVTLTRRQNGALRIKSSVLFWNFLISLRASVPGLYLRRFLSAKECFGASR